MMHTLRTIRQWAVPGVVAVLLLSLCAVVPQSFAITAIPTPPPEPGSFGVEATKTQPPPIVAATITTPGSGASYTNSPITVSGICPNGLLVQIYNNGVMVGAVMCTNGSFSMQVSLFAGTNELTAIDYDNLGQAGPPSNTVTVNYTDTNFVAFGSLVTLTSAYGRRAAPAGSNLSWPLQLSGGNGPYAFSIDWGDGTKPQLKSQALSGIVTIDHVYKKAGIYQVSVTVTDSNGVSAFLQLVAVSSGKVDTTSKSATTAAPTVSITRIVWIPAVVALFLLFPTYWLGRRSQLVSLRNKMLKERDAYEQKQ